MANSEDVVAWAERSLSRTGYGMSPTTRDMVKALAAEVRELRERDAQRDAAEGELLARVEELRRDRARLDWLESEMERDGNHSLFRQNMPITRAAIDAAMGGGEGEG